MKMLTEGQLIELLRNAYQLGFMTAAEGSNGEYFGDGGGGRPIDCENWRYHRDRQIEPLVNPVVTPLELNNKTT